MFRRKPSAFAEQSARPAADAAGLAKKTPFWKKEISFRRKRKPAEAAGEAKKKTSFWKKEISFRRKRKAPAEAPGAAEKKTPFWKKEISFRRGRKAPAEADAEPRKKKAARLPRLRIRVRTRGKRLVGLKVGASQLAAARVVNNGFPELVQVAREPLQPGVVVGGELREPDALALALKSFFRKHKLPRSGVRLGIANNRIGVRIFEIPGIEDPAQLANAIRFRAQETLPIPVEEAVLDYQILGESVDDEGVTMRQVLLVVAYRDLIDRYVAACKKAGLKLAGIDLEAFAILRALAPPREEGGEDAPVALVAVNLGHDRSTFAVSDGRACQFTRVLEWGGSSLDVAIARALDLTPHQAEPVKLSLSLAEPSIPAGLSTEQAAKVREAVQLELQSFARELVSSLHFYQNQPGALAIGELVLTGGTAGLPGLAAELGRLIGVRVRVGDPLARVKVGKRVDAGDRLGSLATAIGLGIED